MNIDASLEWHTPLPQLVRMRLWLLALFLLPVLAVLATVWTFAGAGPGGLLLPGLTCAVVLAAMAAAWGIRIEARHYGHALLDDGLMIKGGVWWRSVIFVPRVRIQHTDVSEGPLQRRFGLATLVLHTAGVRQAELRVDGLSPPQARALRDQLLARSSMPQTGAGDHAP